MTTNTELVAALSTILDGYHLHVRGGSNAWEAACERKFSPITPNLRGDDNA